ncbi:MAG: carboxypeptidase regulatory-like domain-containing protein [Bryobacteraceae bacterium]
MSVLLLLVFAAAAFAQGTATIYGTVTDNTGAVVPGAAVTVTSTLTGATRQVNTDEAGNYVVVQLPVGVFSVRVQSTGFKEYVQTEVQIQVNENRRVDAAMEVGQVTERIEVAAVTTQVDTRSGTIGEVIDQRRISDLPLNGRNPLQLTLLMAGAGRRGGREQQQNDTISVNGSGFRSNNYQLDGGDNQDPFFNTAAPFPNPDALQEFSIETNGYGADKGRNSGAFVSAVTRSGTNQFHGALFEYLRNEKLNARDFFATNVPPFKRNQYGGTLGGPIRKDKLFFFFSFQGTRENSAPGTITTNAPNEALRRGDFSGTTRNILDPDTRQPFPNRIIPASRLYAPSQQFLETYIPLPNRPDGLLSFASSDGIDDDQIVGKVDYQFTQNHRWNWRLLWNYNDTRQAVGTIPNLLASIVYRNWNGTFSDTWVVNPTTVHSLTFTAQNIRREQAAIAAAGKTWSDFGAGVVRAHSEDTAAAISTNVIGYFNAFTRYPLFQERHFFHINDSLSLTRGAHLIKLGGELRYSRVDRVERFQGDAALTFRGQIMNDAFAELLLGRVAQINQSSGGESYPRGREYVLFVQDDWKVTRRLTFNLGLRWDPFTPPRDKRGTGPLFRPGEQSTFFPLAPTGLVYWERDDAVPKLYGFGNKWRNFAPRFGFAWDPFGDGKNSVRGGYGIFYASRALQQIGGGGPGYVLSFVLDPIPGGLADPYGHIGGNPFPFTAPETPDERANFQFIPPVNTGNWSPDFRNGVVQQWNLALQRELARGWVFTTAYVATKGNSLEGANQSNPGVFGRPGNLQQRRLYPQFSAIGTSNSWNNMTYNSLQVTLNKRLSRGFSILTSYTWSKQLDTNDPIDGIDVSREKAVSVNNIAHRYVASYIWELPRLRGQNPFLRHVLGGWETNGIVSLESGQPFNVTSGRDNSGTGINSDRPDLAGNPFLSKDRPRSELIDRWFETSAFRQNPAGTFGTAGRNLMTGPGQAVVDLGLVKNFAITESHRIQFRAEAFNAFNRVNLDGPNGNLNNPTFGRITSSGAPRVFQVALRYNF